jgi:hypothetical protein
MVEEIRDLRKQLAALQNKIPPARPGPGGTGPISPAE